MMNTMKMKLMSALLAVSVIFGSFALPTTVAAYDFDDDDYWYYDDDDEYLDDYEDLIRMELIAHHYDKKYNSYVSSGKLDSSPASDRRILSDHRLRQARKRQQPGRMLLLNEPDDSHS